MQVFHDESKPVNGFMHKSQRIDPLPFQMQPLRFHLRYVEQIVNHPRKIEGRGSDFTCEFFSLFAAAFTDPRQEVGAHHDGSDRLPQIVSDDRGPFLPHPLQPLQLCNVLDGTMKSVGTSESISNRLSAQSDVPGRTIRTKELQLQF